jgi:anti-anti-sigma regulatory factor
VPYELTVTANRPDPNNRAGRAPRQATSFSILRLNGTLDGVATDDVLAAVAREREDNRRSIVLELGDVVAEDDAALGSLVRGIMALREGGTEVQISAQSDAMHERLMGLPDARDWLLSRSADVTETPRRSLHLDGPG